MLSELLQKLESEHGIAPAQGQRILNTIVQHIKENFPAAGPMIDKILGGESSATTTNTDVQNNSENESDLEKLEDLAKSKLGGLFGGNKI